MKVSVVIPVYNVEKYLEMCIESVLAQELKDIEVILVDDGSKDASGQICDAYAERDSRIKVIHQQNGGLSHARNQGVKAATGEYIFFLDSDDCIHPLALLKLTELAEKYQASLVQMDLEHVPEDFSDYRKDIGYEFEAVQFDTIDAFYNIDKDDKSIAKDIRLVTLVAWSKLYKKELFDSILFPEDIKLHEDQMVAHRYIVQAQGIVFCKAPLYFYRNRPNSLITEGWTPKRLTILDCYKDRVEWAKKVPEDGERVKDLVYYIYIRYLVCMFKNYWMASRRLHGEERHQCHNDIMQRYRKELREFDLKWKYKDYLVYHMFGRFPNIFTGCYQIVWAVKERIGK